MTILACQPEKPSHIFRYVVSSQTTGLAFLQHVQDRITALTNSAQITAPGATASTAQPNLADISAQSCLGHRARNFIQVSDVWFRSLFAFVIVELSSRRVVHLPEATPFGQCPKHLIRNNNQKYG